MQRHADAVDAQILWMDPIADVHRAGWFDLFRHERPAVDERAAFLVMLESRVEDVRVGAVDIHADTAERT